MLAPRTVKILIALFLAMTGGTLVLTWLDVEPIRAPGTHLTAVAFAEESPLAVVTSTKRPLNILKWRNIVIHGSAEGAATVGNCHFVVEPADTNNPLGIRANGAWMDQAESPHVPPGPGPNWGKDTIGVCMVGDFSLSPPSDEQWKALVKLVTDLQKKCNVPASQVYLYRTIRGSSSPGAAFPEEEFNKALDHTVRGRD